MVIYFYDMTYSNKPTPEEFIDTLLNISPERIISSLEEDINEREMSILQMRFKENMTLREIGKMFNVSYATIDNILIRHCRENVSFRICNGFKLRKEIIDIECDHLKYHENILSGRTVRSLSRNNITTVADLIKLSINELINIRGIGVRSMSEIIYLLYTKDLTLIGNFYTEDDKKMISKVNRYILENIDKNYVPVYK